ncbi:Superfamily II DNA or RNA helicase, SNF2 family [Rubritalea squalenifaciens DSM 18772]|uniref:Superfamily II DNA or RNA helicase, SNF2 family n=2 Tax=Rubritalea squalenifaciens TaxID=407226 RepID=A0A1M6R6P5_9BACT|nr:Superfamily II DNA or RNA helicase, SNF2 family [Rubritalea squalenifaciens DSM 18772]
MQSQQIEMNPDRATLNFLNSFPEEARNRGETLQQEGAVTQIFGNHLFIQGRVEDRGGVFRTSLRLQGNRWFGSCTAEDEITAGACLYATMMERMHRGEDLPESPNEFDDTPIIDLIEDKLDREVDDKEADFVSKVEKRYRRYVIEGEIHDHDMVRLNPRWEIVSYDPLELWPMPPGDIIEFWNYIAYAFYKKKLPYPDFMNCITDLEAVQKKMQDWEKEREIAEWYDRIESVNERPPQEKPLKTDFRVVSTINEARVEVREEDGEWMPIREKNDIERLVGLFEEAALRMDAQSQVIWEHYLAFYHGENATTMDLDTEEACRFMNRLFRQSALKGHIVNLDDKHYKVTKDALRWVCEDDPYYPDSFALQLVTKSGENVSHSVRILPGREELYQSDETVFPGPPRWLDDTEVMPRYMIPKQVVDSLEGVEFLRKIGAKLPESLKKRVLDLDLYPRFEMRIEQGLTAAETEHLVINVNALEKKERRTEKLVKEGWELVEQKPVKGKQLLRFAREDLYPVPSLLQEMGLTYDEKLGEFKTRVTKQFPEKFAEWANKMPESVDVEMDFKLKTLLADPVTAAIRFEVVNQDIDWFDLKIVIDVEGVNLTKAQIRQLVAARGGYVRMEDGGWMRLEIKLDDDQREAVTRLGLDPFDLSGETHRMHALQLADPKAAEVFDPKAWKRIKDSAQDIQVDVDADVPEGLNATLRPYQVEGFRFLAYLSTNRFGGILADDMGLGKTIQSITYVLWLREQNMKEKNAIKKPALVVCPKSVLDVWATEAEKFAPELKVKVLRTRDDLIIDEAQNDLDLVVLNYAQLRVCGEDLNTIKWLTVILDEGQQIKNPDSKAAKSARELNAANRLVLTGTPIENRLMDMWSLMAFAMPGVLGSRAYFKKRFDKRKDPSSQTRLAARLRPFLLRRTKLQVAKDLPPRTEEEVFASMEGLQAEMYKAELKRIQKALLGLDSDEAVKKNSFAILQGLMRLRQICCHPGLIDPKYLKEESAKMTALFYLLDQLRDEGHKVLVFSQFVSMLDIIKARLETESRPYHYLTGQTKDRKGVIESFQTTKDPSVFMLSLKAGGAGLNLTSASYVILYDPWWNPAVENQAIDRTHRIGQKNKVIAYRLLTRDTVEEKIRVLQHQKTALVTNVLGDEGFASNLGVEDLQFILNHGGEMLGDEE